MCRIQLAQILLGVTLVAARSGPFYRKDYNYIADFDAFYKLHINITGFTFIDAFLSCNDEGAQLFYPVTPEEKVVAKLQVSASKNSDITEIFVGIHDEFHIGEYVTVDGSSTPFPILESSQASSSYGHESTCVVMHVETGEFSIDSCKNWNRPFICKKSIDPKPCNTVDTGYIYKQETGKCYKVNNKRRTWHDAFKTCYLEGASLVVIKDKAEYNYVMELIEKYTIEEKDEVDSGYFLGIHRLRDNDEYYTVKGNRLNGGAYQYWQGCENSQEHNSIFVDNCLSAYSRRNRESCYKPVSCFTKLRYICEMQAFRNF